MASGAGSTMVIVGGGLAAGNAAVTLREEGHAGPVILVSKELEVPYGRPPLSKTYLRGEEPLSDWYVKPEQWYAEHEVEMRSGSSVTRIDTDLKRVTLDSGELLGYDRLLLATGGRNRRLQVPGAGLPGVHQLRTVGECDAIRAAARPGARAAVVGMGFIGCEVAASLRQLGLEVAAVASGPAPLIGVLGDQVGRALGEIHREKGVELLTEDQVVAFEGDGRLQTVVTAKGGRIACDLAVAGIGIEPEVEILRDAGLELDNGVLVDGRCQTSQEDVYAAGDVANHEHPLFGRVRVEHFNNAERQGRAAARSMLGAQEPYDYVHSFWSDQYENKIEYVGHATRWDQFVIRGSLEERVLLGFYLEAGVLRAAVGLDRGGDPEAEPESEMAACALLVGQRARPSPDDLANEAVSLWSLVGR